MQPGSRLRDLLEEAFPSGWDRAGTCAPEDRLRACLMRRDSWHRSRILQEVRGHLDRGLCDMQLSELIAFELGCHLEPAELGLTASQWLAWVARQVAHEERPTASPSSARDDLA